MKPHRHADVLRAIADGKDVEWQSLQSREWLPVFASMNPIADGHLNWRIKPEPKPDVVQFHRIEVDETGYVVARLQSKFHNLKLTFDGETGALKSAEVLK